MDGFHVNETRLSHPVEMGPHGVGMQPKALSELAGRSWSRRTGQLLVDGEAGVVPESLVDGKCVHYRLTVASCWNIFKELTGLMGFHES